MNGASHPKASCLMRMAAGGCRLSAVATARSRAPTSPLLAPQIAASAPGDMGSAARRGSAAIRRNSASPERARPARAANSRSTMQPISGNTNTSAHPSLTMRDSSVDPERLT